MTPDSGPALSPAAAAARAAFTAEARSPEPEPGPGDTAAEDAAARRALARLAQAGLLKHAAPAAGALSVRTLCAVREELAYASGLADVMFVMQGLGSAALSLSGAEEARRRWLPGVGDGSVIAAFALTEPDAGSDAGAVSTSAVRDGDGYVINGEKRFITNAGIAGLYTVFARTGPPGSGSKGVTAFAVDAAAPGIRVARSTVTAPHPIGSVHFDGCRVPSAARLGEEGSGYALALRVLDRFRPTVAAAATGFARRALDESVRHARERAQFGRPLAEFQAIRFKVADMATWLEAARMLVTRAAELADETPGTDATRRAASMAKLYATEAAQRIVDEAVQIHGGLGVTRGHVVERLYREVRALRIYEGTSEIQRLIIARSLLKEGA